MKKGKQEDLPVPDHLRCRRTDGRQWRCKRRVLESKTLCEVHFQRGQKRRPRLKEDFPLPVPENLRCGMTDGDQWRCKRRVLDNEKHCEVHFHRTRRKQEKLARFYAESQSIGQEEKVCEPQNLVSRQCQDKQSKFSSDSVSFEENEECEVENLENIKSHYEEEKKRCEVEDLVVCVCETKRTKYFRKDTSSAEDVVECEVQNLEKNEFAARIQSIDEDDEVCEVENVIDRQCRFKRTKFLGENTSSDENDVILVGEEEDVKELKLENPMLQKCWFKRSKFSRENADFQENVDGKTHKFQSKRPNFSRKNKNFQRNGVVYINEEPVPENLRCSKTDGRKWRCSRRVVENKKLCEFHHTQSRQYQYKPIKFFLEKSRGFKGKVKKPVVVEEDKKNISEKSRGLGKVKKPVVVEEVEENLPENLRCCRSDGRKWRCNRRVMKDKKLCQIHYLQGRHRQYKEKVPEELKIQRKIRGSNVESQEMKIQSVDVKRREADELTLKSIMTKKKKKKKKKRAIEVLEGLIRALKEMKLRKNDLQLELIRIFLRRQVERCKQRDLEKPKEGELMRDLPYGLMAISPPTSPFLTGIDSFCNVKLGINSSCFTRRCFRSKNIEPLPRGSVKVVPYVRGVANLRTQCRMICHRCRRSNLESLIKCSSCQKEFFCLECISEWYCNVQEEVEKECPVCCKTCECKACMNAQSEGMECVSGLLE
ncbi:WRC domain [Dillenia turbinata]|uniref:Growth-regulating factor n=1 Tax=Dillenia turbinata TaxID=194707 RepID=A0AAN8YZ15_9MAGN